MDVDTRVDIDQVERDLRAAHYAIPNALRAALREAAEEVGLPAVQAAAPSFGRPLLLARSSTRVAYITTRGPKQLDRALGLLNYGGIVRGRIEPKRAGRERERRTLLDAVPSAGVGRSRGPRALGLPWGPRAAVTKPRRYRGKHFLETAVSQSLPAVIERHRDKVLAIYSERGWNTEKGSI